MSEASAAGEDKREQVELSPASRTKIDDTSIWNGDSDIPLKPWHPLHEPARFPADETQRVGVIKSLGLDNRSQADLHLDTMAIVTRRAYSLADPCNSREESPRTISAAVNFIDSSSQWSKASAGYDMCRVDRDISICAHTILAEHERASTLGCLVVLDTDKDTRFRYSDLCTVGTYRIRFYVGVPLYVSQNGVKWPVGTLCIFDTKPRVSFSLDDCRILSVLGKAVSDHICSRPPPQASLPTTPTTTSVSTRPQKIEFLKKCMAFTIRKVDVDSIEQLADKLTPSVVQQHQFVARKGDPSSGMFFVVSGTLQCSLDGRKLELLERGQCLGEVSIMNISKMISQGLSLEEARHRCSRANDVVALEETELLHLSLSDAWPLLNQIPNLWYSLRDLAQQRMVRVLRFSPSPPTTLSALLSAKPSYG
mmetsp:Transcript_50970/g.74667  ORF Transcript_50970/g.74667 Transcript_50970/m.74667 type:complete len:423 (+) Transcript_50970:50-1318(+)